MTDWTDKASQQSPQSHPRRFDQATYRQLSGIKVLILEELEWLSKCQAKKSLTGAKYCTPGQKYLARKLGVRRQTISRQICQLGALGIIDIEHRPPVAGQYTTNLYRIRSWKWWKLGAVLHMLKGKLRRARQPEHKTYLKKEIETLKRPKGEPSAVFLEYLAWVTEAKLKFPALDWS